MPVPISSKEAGSGVTTGGCFFLLIDSGGSPAREARTAPGVGAARKSAAGLMAFAGRVPMSDSKNNDPTRVVLNIQGSPFDSVLFESSVQYEGQEILLLTHCK